MFSFNYYLKTVNAEKSIVRLTPTLGTYVKAFAPTLILGGGVMLFGLYSEYIEKQNLKQDLDTTEA